MKTLVQVIFLEDSMHELLLQSFILALLPEYYFIGVHH
jgi:hypothetical protein